MQTAIAAAGVSGLASFLIAHRVSYQRLKGYRENESELDKYGIEKKKLVAVVKKRPVLPREELVKDV